MNRKISGDNLSGSLDAIEWHAATRPLPGQRACGDLCAVLPIPKGVVLAVADGLGHGEEAAEAARVAMDTVERHREESVIALVQRCHERLRETRGAVMSIAAMNVLEDSLTWVGVGDVEGVLFRASTSENVRREYLLRRAGVLGDRLTAPSASIVTISTGDLLILATDGIRSNFIEEDLVGQPPQEAADRILRKYWRKSDDALVLAARYLGGASSLSGKGKP